MRCSQVEQDVLRQEAVVLRYTPHVILTKPAQKLTPFSGMAPDVLAPLHIYIVHAGSYLKLDEHWLSIFPEEWTAEDRFPFWRKETRPQGIILPRVID
jgi:hypothetical protein